MHDKVLQGHEVEHAPRMACRAAKLAEYGARDLVHFIDVECHVARDEYAHTVATRGQRLGRLWGQFRHGSFLRQVEQRRCNNGTQRQGLMAGTQTASSSVFPLARHELDATQIVKSLQNWNAIG